MNSANFAIANGSSTQRQAIQDHQREMGQRLAECQLEAEREVDRENRRLLLAALERIPPALEGAPSEPSEGAAPASEESGGGTARPGEERPSERPWWRRVFGG